MRTSTIIIITLLIAVLAAASGCTTKESLETTEDTTGQKSNQLELDTYMNYLEVPSEYQVEYEASYADEIGGHSWYVDYGIRDEKYVECQGYFFHQAPEMDDSRLVKCSIALVKAEKDPFRNKVRMAEIAEYVRKLDLGDSKAKSFIDRRCFYQDGTEEYGYRKALVCFARGSIVNFAAADGYQDSQVFWNLKGYPFTDEVMELLN